MERIKKKKLRGLNKQQENEKNKNNQKYKIIIIDIKH